jgi:hypothetical protein
MSIFTCRYKQMLLSLISVTDLKRQYLSCGPSVPCFANTANVADCHYCRLRRPLKLANNPNNKWVRWSRVVTKSRQPETQSKRCTWKTAFSNAVLSSEEDTLQTKHIKKRNENNLARLVSNHVIRHINRSRNCLYFVTVPSTAMQEDRA